MINSIQTSASYINNDAFKAKNTKATVKTQDEEIKSNLSPKAAMIAEQIKNGEYVLDLKESAKAILKELFNDRD